jgi:ElaB/YqjD/DUF883 family membrane-anchored ribosome-binding protein
MADSEPQAGGERTPEQIEAEIERTREGLGDTVAALAEKTDVKRQAKQRVDATKERAQEKAEAAREGLEAAPETARRVADSTLTTVRSNPLPAVGGLLVAGVLVVAIARRRR